MARKSRKNFITNENSIVNKNNEKIYYVGVYVRLSRFDNLQDNDTIEN